MAALEILLWPPSNSQIKQKAMYELRLCIRKGVSVSSEEAQRTLEKLPKPLTSEALKAKDLRDGQNLLVYAASCGRADWFLYLAKQLVHECGTEALVKELREFDIDGAPLLFLAASSRTSTTCFHEVFHTLRAFLGVGGLLEQIEANDHHGRNIIMYAARGKHVDVFKCVLHLYKNMFARQEQYAELGSLVQTEPIDGTDEASNLTEEEACCIPIPPPLVRCVRSLGQGNCRKLKMALNARHRGGHDEPVQNTSERTTARGATADSTGGSTGACECLPSANTLWALRGDQQGDSDVHVRSSSGSAVCFSCNTVKMMRTRGLRQGISKRKDCVPERWVDRVVKADHTGKNLLHHAAEAASLAVLNLVYKLAQELGYDVPERMTVSDQNGRTPIMLFLRNKYDSYNDCEGEARDKMNHLWLRATREGWMKKREVPPVWEKESVCQSEVQIQKFATIGRTELFHAVHGGPVTLDLVLEVIRKHQKRFRSQDGDIVFLDKVLGMAVQNQETTNGNSQHSPHDAVPTIQPNEKWHTRICQKVPVSTSLEQKARYWGYGMLLAAAVKGGHVEVIKRVVSAIEMGCFLPENMTWGGTRDKGGVVAAIDAINDSGRCLFRLAVMSGKPDAAKHVYLAIIRVYSEDSSKVWDLLRGPKDENSPLTIAASAPMTAENCGVKMLLTVFHCLHKAAREYLGQTEGDLAMVELIRFRPSVEREERLCSNSALSTSSKTVSPLGAAALRSNWVLFRLLYDLYETFRQERWSRDEVLFQLPKNAPDAFSFEKNQEMHEFRQHANASFRSGAEGLSSVLWHDIVEAYRRATPGEGSDMKGDLPSWRGFFKDYSRRAVEEAVQTMFFDDLRELVKEGFPLHDEQIPELLENIEDHEQDVVDIVMFAVGNASNPLVMSAGVSKNIKTAETESPMHRTGLRRLQRMIDEMTDELTLSPRPMGISRALDILVAYGDSETPLLDKLPHTVRGVGLKLLRPIVPEDRLSPVQQRRRSVLANLAGFIAVEWILEPRLLVGKATDGTNYDGPNYLDPLQRAVDRGSEALEFVNNPLVLDYLHWKFNCSLPHWASRKPNLASVNEGFYTFRNFDRYKLSELSGDRLAQPQNKEAYTDAWDSSLLRFLQGWVPDRDSVHVSVRRNLDRESNGSISRENHGSHEKTWQALTDWRNFPRSTILPGLQFLLAGIIGKPETFYEVPVVHFSFELFNYVIMLVLFCSCVILEKNDFIPSVEWAFYFFVAGLVWREILEFLDGMPARQFRKGRKVDDMPSRKVSIGRKEQTVSSGSSPLSQRKDNSVEPGQNDWRPGSNKTGGKHLNQMVSGLARYILHDTWNLLDVLSITFVTVAFIFRLKGLPKFGGQEEPGDDFFLSQFFLAWSAPLLFARLLLLSQIDGTLGPMIQILWRLMSHTIRFSAFIIVVLTSFSLAFHAVFIKCDQESDLFSQFGTFPTSLLTMFGVALGEFEGVVENLQATEADCPDSLSSNLAYVAGIVFLVAYLVVMAVVLLNLLIAVLSSEHQKVHSKGEMEFHLARTRLIMQTSLAVTHRRIPAPFNLIQVGVGFIFDGFQECSWHYKRFNRRNLRCPSFPKTSCIEDPHPRPGFRKSINSFNKIRPTSEETPADSGQGPTSRRKERTQDDEHEKFIPATSTYAWFTFEGFIQRGAFALTMGLAAVALSALLWVISLPWVAWSLLRWFFRWDQPRSEGGANTTKNERQGHFRTFFFAIFGIVAWVTALGLAGILCVLSCFGSIILWLRGLWGVVEWSFWRLTEEGKFVSGASENNCPKAMPGQERGDPWRHAWKVVKARNYRIRHESESAHFHIGPLLKSTTGLDMEHLVILVKNRDAKNNRDKEFKAMDKEAAEALFSSQMQYQRTSPRASDVINNLPWTDDDCGVAETKGPTI